MVVSLNSRLESNKGRRKVRRYSSEEDDEAHGSHPTASPAGAALREEGLGLGFRVSSVGFRV